ncbi:MAG: hypothetical protein ABR609_02300 [Acidimicrobiia bacterium]
MSLLRRLRIPAPVQLPLSLPGSDFKPDQRWWSLPEESRREVLALMARLIARSVLVEEGRGGGNE